jgi:hypothetical protein
MTDKPQIKIEEIELFPHEMDAWRAALDALIACAPGDGPAIAAHLQEAKQQALIFVDRTRASDGTAKLVNRLMLIGAGRLVGDRLQATHNELGFSHQAPLLGIDAAALRSSEAGEISHRLLAHLARSRAADPKASDAPPSSQHLAESSPAYPDRQQAHSDQGRAPALGGEPTPNTPNASQQQEQEGQ